MPHRWNPKQYEKFQNERAQPFFDLLQLIHPLHHPRIVDLGCGNGSLTKIAHEKFHATYTLGIDSSEEMLSKAKALEEDQLKFKHVEIQRFSFEEPFNLMISNAALQWIPNHEILFHHLKELLAPGGQMAIQMPANQNYPTHVLAAELAAEEPFKQAFKRKGVPTNHLLTMEEYAQLFDKLGFENQTIRIQLYAHFLESTASVIEWVKGSLLTYYQSFLSPDLYALFLKEYQERLMKRLGWSEPFFFPVQRLFLWGQLPFD